MSAAIEADAPFLFALLGGSLWSWPTAKLLCGQVRKRGLRGLAAWFGAALAPARGWLETGYQSPLVQALYAPWVLHSGLTPESTYSGQMGKVIAFALEAAGAPVVKGGAGPAVAAFQRADRGKGRRDPHAAPMSTGFWSTDGRVTGVALASGEEIACALGPRLGRAGAVARAAAARREPARGSGGGARPSATGAAISSCTTRWTAPPEWLSPGLDDVALIHLADGIDSVSKSVERGGARDAARHAHDLRRPAAPA